MMFDNFSLNLLAGGFYRTTPRWNKGSESQDPCYKCYLPVRGRAKVVTAEGSYTIQSGAMYFIPGFHLKSQSCEREMTVHWVHFTPDSFYLHRRLSRIRGVVAWPLRGLRWLVRVFSRISEVFENPGSEENRLLALPQSIWSAC